MDLSKLKIATANSQRRLLETNTQFFGTMPK